MIGPYQNEEEILQELLYWQKRALSAEKELEKTLDDLEYYIIISSYFKDQFLDKQGELELVIKMGDTRR